MRHRQDSPPLTDEHTARRVRLPQGPARPLQGREARAMERAVHAQGEYVEILDPDGVWIATRCSDAAAGYYTVVDWAQSATRACPRPSAAGVDRAIAAARIVRDMGDSGARPKAASAICNKVALLQRDAYSDGALVAQIERPSKGTRRGRRGGRRNKKQVILPT